MATGQYILLGTNAGVLPWGLKASLHDVQDPLGTGLR